VREGRRCDYHGLYRLIVQQRVQRRVSLALQLLRCGVRRVAVLVIEAAQGDWQRFYLAELSCQVLSDTARSDNRKTQHIGNI
jgi:hypothetical protein